MLTYDLNAKNKYWSLYSHIRDDILQGRLKRGEKLPSKRSLAENLSVSVITVQNAYEQLLAEGYVRSEERSGYFVEDVNAAFYGKRDVAAEERREEKKFHLDFVKGSVPAELFPFSTWARLMRKVLSDCGEHLLERVPCDGDRELKTAISNYLYRARGISADPRFIVIGAGAEYLYGVIVNLLGRDKLYAVENPGYNKISASYTLNGAKCAYIPVTTSGISCEGVELSGADVAHVSPSHQYPTGAVTPVSARSRLISWANGGDRYVIEDDYDSEFRLCGKPLQSTYSLCPDRVIYMNTFSKSLAPSMRMGYMVLPPKLYDRYIKLFSHSACVVPLFEQKTLAAMLDGGYFERLINRLKNYYRAVRAALLEKGATLSIKCEISDTGSGLHMLVKFPDAPSDEYIKKTAALNGINLKCLSDYLLAPLDGVEKTAVINYSGLSPELIKNLKIV
ncbi:MAG: PLP-dependent aminotransferase family protein [Clostridia bacterium]|nr:PLP-dependent aminotransferase family protein [Clostridia bacterium]